MNMAIYNCLFLLEKWTSSSISKVVILIYMVVLVGFNNARATGTRKEKTEVMISFICGKYSRIVLGSKHFSSR